MILTPTAHENTGTVVDVTKSGASSAMSSSAAARDATRRVSMFNKPNMTPQQASAAAPVNRYGSINNNRKFTQYRVSQQEMIYKNVVKRYEEQAEVLLAENEELRLV